MKRIILSTVAIFAILTANAQYDDSQYKFIGKVQEVKQVSYPYNYDTKEYEDGLYKSLEYNPKGNLKSSYARLSLDPSTIEVKVYAYDDNDRITRIDCSREEEGKEEKYTVELYTYDRFGKLETKKKHDVYSEGNSRLTHKTIVEKDSRGYDIKEIQEDVKNSSVLGSLVEIGIECDDSGNRVFEEAMVVPKSWMNASPYVDWTKEYHYDDDSNLEVMIHSKWNQWKQKVEYSYHEYYKDNTLKRKILFLDKIERENIQSTETYTYDVRGNLVCERYYDENGELQQVKNYEYDSWDNLLSEKMYQDGKEEPVSAYLYTYSYDERNNWIKLSGELTFEGEIHKMGIRIREIIYYE